MFLLVQLVVEFDNVLLQKGHLYLQGNFQQFQITNLIDKI